MAQGRTGRNGKRRRGTSGTAAIEFALVAPAFFMLLFAIVETGLVYFANTILQNGVNETSRLIKTGQAQTPGNEMDANEFRAALCDQIDVILSCSGDMLTIDVLRFGDFGSSAYPPALNQDGELNENLGAYETGGAGDVILVRAFYKWELFTPMFAQYYANLGSSTRLVTASTAFRNEPF